MSWIQRAKPGDKVVVVAQTPEPLKAAYWASLGYRGPEVGEVCTVREIYQSRYRKDRAMMVLLEEYRNEPKHVDEDGNLFEGGFLASRFRPVEPRKTDISVFTDMLKTVGKPVKEDA